jgi:hypothetical protein
MTITSVLQAVFLLALVATVAWLVYLGWMTRDDA